MLDIMAFKELVRVDQTAPEFVGIRVAFHARYIAVYPGFLEKANPEARHVQFFYDDATQQVAVKFFVSTGVSLQLWPLRGRKGCVKRANSRSAIAKFREYGYPDRVPCPARRQGDLWVIENPSSS